MIAKLLAAGIPPLYNRLKLDEMKLRLRSQECDVGQLSDPGGVVQIHRQLDDGLILKRITSARSAGRNFEARPDAAIQISSLD